MKNDDLHALPDDISQLKQLVISSRAALERKNKVVIEHSNTRKP